MQVKVKKLGLAAFMHLDSDATLEGVTNRGHYVFETQIPLSQWEVKYTTSLASRFNSALMDLRNLKNTTMTT